MISLIQFHSLVAQEPFLWHSSLRDNLDPDNSRAEADIWAALKRVSMIDAVSALPEKLDTVLEDSGSFSKGQVIIAYSPFSRFSD
jgi:ATP-binding cassette, subfamily C (CFTR/MRP), member 1